MLYAPEPGTYAQQPPIPNPAFASGSTQASQPQMAPPPIYAPEPSIPAPNQIKWSTKKVEVRSAAGGPPRIIGAPVETYCGPQTQCITCVLCFCLGPFALCSVFCPCDEVHTYEHGGRPAGATHVVHGAGHDVAHHHHHVVHHDPYGYETGLIAGAVTGLAVDAAMHDIGGGYGGDWGGDYGGDWGGDGGGDWGGDGGDFGGDGGY